MNDRPSIIITDERMLEHANGPGHPERPERLRAVIDAVRAMQQTNLQWREPRGAEIDSIKRVHDGAYVDSILALKGQSRQLDPDTAVSPGSIDAALLAAGAAIDAVDAVMKKDAESAFALVRPPGHHAERDRAMGFCLFNNIAVAAQHAIDSHDCKRVMIIDWDVHHGNGTQHIFEARRDVLFVSLHRYGGFYPGTGAIEEIGTGQGEGYSINLPLNPRVTDRMVIPMFEAIIPKLASDYQPEFILVSAGFDAHERDPLGGLNVTTEGFARMCAVTRDAAQQHADGKLVLVLEGGYDLQALAMGVTACIEVLRGRPAPWLEIWNSDPSVLAEVDRWNEFIMRMKHAWHPDE